jgi:hypothetical protein
VYDGCAGTVPGCVWFVSSILLPFDPQQNSPPLPLDLPSTISVSSLGGFQIGSGNCGIEKNHSFVETQTSVFQSSKS